MYRQDEYWDVTNEQLDLSRTVLVDNNPVCHVMYPQNGILVPSFFDDPRDQELAKVAPSAPDHVNIDTFSGQSTFGSTTRSTG